MKYLLFPHGGCENHGCEAIVRTTKEMLCDNQSIILFSENCSQDIKYLGEKYIDIRSSRERISRFSLKYLEAYINYHFRHILHSFDILAFRPILSQCNGGSVLLSIGGDNYCYGENEYLYMINQYARSKGVKTILWGCSIDPEIISKKMKEDLKQYNLIIARESITYKTLLKVNKNTVLCPDPAFTLDSSEGILPEGLNNKEFIGINISPLIQNKELISGMVLENYRRVIEYILKDSEFNIALIPHVIWDENDDRIPLEKLYREFCCSKRIYLIEDQNCMQLKDIISKCRFFIGARTHAMIAAYSSCVPALAVGYSVKATGIARDIFGNSKHYVVPIKKMIRATELLESFLWVKQNEARIRKMLEEIIPQYIENAKSAELLLKNGEIGI